MTAYLDSIFDPYGRKARLYPAFLALIPVFALITFYTNWLELKPSSAVWIVVASATLFALADFSRQRGKAVEKTLLSHWDGFPSKTLLRHRDDAIDPQTTARYHRAAERLIDGLKMPTVEEEDRNPKDSDDAYQTVTQYLLPKTRDKAQFGLLCNENVNYGFRRNMLGLKPIALLINVVSIAYLVWMNWPVVSAGTMPEQRSIGLFAGLIGLCVFWTFFVSAERVKSAAIDYANQLLMALDMLDSLEKD